jgi:hypothetical protein
MYNPIDALQAMYDSLAPSDTGQGCGAVPQRGDLNQSAINEKKMKIDLVLMMIRFIKSS